MCRAALGIGGALDLRLNKPFGGVNLNENGAMIGLFVGRMEQDLSLIHISNA